MTPRQTVIRWIRADTTLAAALVLAICAVPTAAGQDGVRFRHLGVRDGLPTNDIGAILRDGHGTLWLGTADGLVRHNGSTMEVFRPDPADSTTLSDGEIRRLAELDGRFLLVGTRNGGLNVFDRRTSRVARTSGAEGSGRPTGASVVWIEAYGDGSATVAYRNGELWRVSDEGRSIRPIRVAAPNPLEGKSLSTVSRDAAGRLWVGTWELGLYALEPDGAAGYREVPNLAPEVPGGRVRAIHHDAVGRVYIATSGAGLLCLDPRTGEQRRWNRESGLTDNRLYALIPDRWGRLWMGTINGGINVLSTDRERVTVFRHDPKREESLTGDWINELHIDPGGMLWAGGESGVDYVPLEETRFDGPAIPAGAQFDASIPCPSVPDCAIATGPDGVLRFELAPHGETAPERLVTGPAPGRTVSALAVAGAAPNPGTLFLGTVDSGLFERSPSDWRGVPVHARGNRPQIAVHAMDHDGRGTLWIGTDGDGLLALDAGAGWSRVVSRLSPDTDSRVLPVGDRPDSVFVPWLHVSAVLAGRESTWFGTFSGHVYRVREPTDEPTEVVLAGPSAVAGRIQDLAAAPGGLAWVAFPDRVMLVGPDGAVHREHVRLDGLPGERLVAMDGLERGGFVAATARILVVSLDGMRVRFVLPPLTAEESIRDVTAVRGDRVLLSTTRSAYTFDPSDFAPVEWSPSIRVVHARAGSITVAEQVESGETITLTTAASSFAFEIAFPNFDRAGLVSVVYRMQGFSPEWSAFDEPGEPLRFSNGGQRSGEFLLEIEARSADGRRVRFEAPVVIPTPWWRSRGLRAGAAIALVLIMAVSAQRRARRKEDRNREVRHLLAISREREQREVARWLHDEPLQDIVTSKVLVQTAHSMNPADALKEADQLLGRAAVGIRRRLAALRPKEVESPDLASAIPACVAQAGLDRVTTVALEDVGQLPDGVASALQSVCRNAMANIARHAEAGSVRIDLRRRWWGVCLRIEDDGKGFAAPDDVLALARQGRFGLLGMEEWMRNAGGELRVRSAVGKGTLLIANAYVGPLGRVGKAWERCRNGLTERKKA